MILFVEFGSFAKSQKYVEASDKVEFDPRQYATYVLNQGTLEEKREFMASVKSKITLQNKIINLTK